MVQALKEKTTITDKTRIHLEEPDALAKLAREIFARLTEHGITQNKNAVLMCIGTDRSTGDALGPLVGTRMARAAQKLFTVCGTLDNPIHASNLEKKIEEINSLYNHPFIIAVDACLGHLESVGCVSVGNGSLLPGAGVNKNLPAVGEIHITGIVNVGGFLEYLVLQNTRLHLVMRLADLIVEALCQVAGKIIPGEVVSFAT